MALKVGTADSFERRYSKKFQSLAANYGIGIEYEEDLAAIDLGLHITLKTSDGESTTGTKVWFQLKGIQRNTLTSEKFDAINDIKYTFKIDHLRQWYEAQEAVYIVIFIESIERFIAYDICKLINEGELNRIPSTQKTYTVHIPKDAEVNEEFWQNLHQHRSMRIDRQSYKGNALAHNRSTDDVLQMPDASLFRRIVGALLAEHRYIVAEELNAALLFPSVAKGAVSVSIGVLYDRYEWIWRMSAEVGYDEDGLRDEGSVCHASGKCAVIVHSQVERCLDVSELTKLRNLLQDRGVKQVLVFINHYALGLLASGNCPCFYAYLQGISSGSKIDCNPQHLEDISQKILFTNNVYMKFQREMQWTSDILREKVRSREWRIMSPEEYFREIDEERIDEEDH